MKASDPETRTGRRRPPDRVPGLFLLPNDGSPIRTVPHRGFRTRGDTSGKQGSPPTAEIRPFTIAAADARHNGLLPLLSPAPRSSGGWGGPGAGVISRRGKRGASLRFSAVRRKNRSPCSSERGFRAAGAALWGHRRREPRHDAHTSGPANPSVGPVRGTGAVLGGNNGGTGLPPTANTDGRARPPRGPAAIGKVRRLPEPATFSGRRRHRSLTLLTDQRLAPASFDAGVPFFFPMFNEALNLW